MDYKIKKNFGQHFLIDENYLAQIIRSVEKLTSKNLLEIGPGLGALTQFLIQDKAVDLKLVEIDEDKINYLHQHFPSLKGKIINADFLKILPPFETDFSIVGNFPYNISSQILFKIIDWRAQVVDLVGMFQKEVAQRIVAVPNNKNYGILSIFVQLYFDVHYLFTVPPSAFNPPPKVDSAVVFLKRKTTDYVIKNQALFIEVVKTSFNQRRKMLRNTLRPFLSAESLKNPIFEKRPEQISIEEFIGIVEKIEAER